MRKSVLLIVFLIICLTLVLTTSLYGRKGDSPQEEPKMEAMEKTVLQMWAWNNEGDYPEIPETPPDSPRISHQRWRI